MQTHDEDGAMAKQRTDLHLRVIWLVLALLTGAAAFSAYGATVDTKDWTWVTTASLLPPSRIGHTATLLKDGRVLVVGGVTKVNDFQYDPIPQSQLMEKGGKSWTLGTMMANPRAANTATLLGDGTVMVAGGYQNVKVDGKIERNSITSCEVLDPGQEKGNPTTPLRDARYNHTATLLNDDPQNPSVLVVGGELYKDNKLESFLQTSERFNPTDKSWTPATLNQPRVSHTATRLPDGRVLVVGGFMNDPYVTAISDCEIYDPGKNEWSPVGSLNHARGYHTATLLSEDPKSPNYGKVLVAGGTASLLNKQFLPSPAVNSYEIYGPNPQDPTGPWVWTCPTDNDKSKRLRHTRAGHTATRLKDGTVLAVAGDIAAGGYTSELYQPDTDSWAYTKSLICPRSGANVLLLTGATATLMDNDDGWLLVTGGGPDVCEFFQPPPESLPSGVAPPVKKLWPRN